ncbi:tRNA lysidine(34) synthetase TilS [Ottowia thiooxydans]|uniref:tRNA lysidine(34) synthetase TilS n=1 Tax=Ottowia thiooxydans TaxID=219182 RepID=UPI000416C8C8|nr:tRNA lysidine(34) synthetase TilS [Ottowia thiooxydans]
MSTSSSPDHIAARAVDEAMARFAATKPALPLAVALSGGADSTALLLACVEHWPGQVVALHVHHGLQAAADDFERHCLALCTHLGIPLHIRRVDARHASGESPEAVAREYRYEAFDALTSGSGDLVAVGTVVIAQHADDQVETILLALSRGAGLRGLAAMPARWTRKGIAYARPLLTVPGAAIRSWLRLREQTWIEDPSNANEQFTRNRIRMRLLPVLEAAFPQFRSTFSRSAAHAAQAQQVLDEVANNDLTSAGLPPRITAIQALSRPRQANLLRYWLWGQYAVTPSSAQLGELLDQIAACTTRGHRMHLKVGTGFVQREGAALIWRAPTAIHGGGAQ